MFKSSNIYGAIIYTFSLRDITKARIYLFFKKVKRVWASFLNNDYCAYSILFLLFTSFSIFIFIHTEKPWDVFPTFCIAYIAIFFSYHGYVFSKEKFRADLLEKRLQFNDDLICFLSICFNDAKDQNKKNDLANKCIQGLGIHKAKSLFGEEVIDFLNRLHNCYVIIQTYKTPESRLSISYNENKDELQKYKTAVAILSNAPNLLPSLFAPYIYFGNYKKQ